MGELTFTGAGGLPIAGDLLPGERDTPVVLLHGGGQTRHSWGETAAALSAAGWRTLSVDLRGHGDSGWPEDGHYELDSFAHDVVAAVDAVGAPPVLVGASLGGFASVRALSLDPPVAASGLILVDVAHRFQISGAQRIVEFMGARESFSDPEEATEMVASYLEGTRERPRDSSGIHKNLRRAEDGSWRWHWDPALVESSRDWIRSIGAFEPLFAETVAGLEIPVMLVRGALSDVLTAEIAEEFAGLVPEVEIVEVDRTGHMVAGDSNDPFTAAVLDFLDRRIA